MAAIDHQHHLQPNANQLASQLMTTTNFSDVLAAGDGLGLGLGHRRDNTMQRDEIGTEREILEDCQDNVGAASG